MLAAASIFLVTTLAGNGSAAWADGLGSKARFNGPMGVAVTSTGTAYVTDWYSNRIRLVTSAGE